MTTCGMDGHLFAALSYLDGKILSRIGQPGQSLLAKTPAPFDHDPAAHPDPASGLRLESPSAQARMIRARCTVRWDVVDARTNASSSFR